MTDCCIIWKRLCFALFTQCCEHRMHFRVKIRNLFFKNHFCEGLLRLHMCALFCVRSFVCFISLNIILIITGQAIFGVSTFYFISWYEYCSYFQRSHLYTVIIIMSELNGCANTCIFDNFFDNNIMIHFELLLKVLGPVMNAEINAFGFELNWISIFGLWIQFSVFEIIINIIVTHI